MIEPEDDGCDDADCRHEGIHKAIISCMDTPPDRDFGVQVFDQVTLFVGRLVVAISRLAFGEMQGVVQRAFSAARNRSLS